MYKLNYRIIVIFENNLHPPIGFRWQFYIMDVISPLITHYLGVLMSQLAGSALFMIICEFILYLCNRKMRPFAKLLYLHRYGTAVASAKAKSKF